MRVEKKYLIDEVAEPPQEIRLRHPGELRPDDASPMSPSSGKRLVAHKAEFHVVKNSSLRVAAQGAEPAGLRGGADGPDRRHRRRQELARRGEGHPRFHQGKAEGRPEGRRAQPALLSAAEVERLADLPSLEALRRSCSGLLNQPATLFVRVLDAVPQGLANVLQAKVRAAEGKA